MYRMRRARAFSPGGITSFFEICDQAADGNPISNEEQIGARGGGFVLNRGVETEVTMSESETPHLDVYINKQPAPEAETTRMVTTMLLENHEPYPLSKEAERELDRIQTRAKMDV